MQKFIYIFQNVTMLLKTNTLDMMNLYLFEILHKGEKQI
jgi:hypothetical protein